MADITASRVLEHLHEGSIRAWGRVQPQQLKLPKTMEREPLGAAPGPSH